MARSLAVALDAPLVASTTSRLLIDLNRPAGHPQLYSAVIRSASAELRAEIASRHYQPYLAEVERLVRLSVERGEAELCARWKAVLKEGGPMLRVRRNYPYYGKVAGLTEQLRRRFFADTYVGIELEVNQGIVIGPLLHRPPGRHRSTCWPGRFRCLV
jgi:hypothetical protein